MMYDPRTDFVTLTRNTAGQASLAEMPGLDYVTAALARAGLFKLSVGQSAPVVNQPSTAWLKPSVPSWVAEGEVRLWNALTEEYESATPSLWSNLLSGVVANVTVRNVAAMKSLLTPPAGTVVEFLGYYEPGDGGGGTARVVTTNPGTADDGLIFASNFAGNWFVRITDQSAFGYPVAWFGAKGDGATTDTVPIVNGTAAAIAHKTRLLFDGKRYRVTAPTSLIGAGASVRWYAVLAQSGMHWYGVYGQTVIVIADNQSTLAAPRDLNFIAGNSAISNLSFINIIFDGNALNNNISANSFCSGSFNMTGNSAQVTGLLFYRCQFNNCAGQNQIVTGQSDNGVAGPLSVNVTISECEFHDNGWYNPDFTAVYGWGEKHWVDKCIFEQNLSLLSTVNRNWAAIEIHGGKQWFTNNKVSGYYIGVTVASNYTNIASDILVWGNSLEVWGIGIRTFLQDTAPPLKLTTISSVKIENNSIFVRAILTAGPGTAQKDGVQVLTHFAVSSFFIKSNTVIFEAGAYVSAGFNIGCTLAGQTNRDIQIRSNHVENPTFGLLARLNSGQGHLDEIIDDDNTYLNIGTGNPGTAGTTGSCFRADDGTVSFGRVASTRNRYIAQGGANFVQGQQFFGSIVEALVDLNVYDGPTSFPGGSPYSIEQASGAIDRRIGMQICTGLVAPTLGTWRDGDRFYSFGMTQFKSISHWEYQTAAGFNNWRAFGQGFGPNVSKPALTAQDSGYIYYDTNASDLLVWNGAAWV